MNKRITIKQGKKLNSKYYLFTGIEYVLEEGLSINGNTKDSKCVIQKRLREELYRIFKGRIVNKNKLNKFLDRTTSEIYKHSTLIESGKTENLKEYLFYLFNGFGGGYDGTLSDELEEILFNNTEYFSVKTKYIGCKKPSEDNLTEEDII